MVAREFYLGAAVLSCMIVGLSAEGNIDIFICLIKIIKNSDAEDVGKFYI